MGGGGGGLTTKQIMSPEKPKMSFVFLFFLPALVNKMSSNREQKIPSRRENCKMSFLLLDQWTPSPSTYQQVAMAMQNTDMRRFFISYF